MRAAIRILGAAMIASLVLIAPAAAFAADSDGDGVPDNADAFPNDGTLAAETYAPAYQQFGQIFFEDLWPQKGDFDFNDETIAYNYLFQLDANNKLVNLKGSFTLLSAGASYHNRVLVHLPIPVGAVASVTLNGLNQAPVPVSSKPGESELTIEISPDTLAAFNDQLVNTEVNKPSQPGVPFNLLVRLSTPTRIDLGQAPFDVYLERTFEAGHEIHLPQFAGSSTMDGSLFNTGDDGSTANRHFVTTGGIPFGLVVPYELAWPNERVRIDTAYPNIIPFGASAGATDADWYLTNVNAASLWTLGAGNTPPPVASIIPPDFPGPTNPCFNQPNGTACNDGNLCTKQDACQNGLCVGVAYSCAAPADSCHDVGACLGDGTCVVVTKANGAACNDGDPCTINEVCQSGVCGAGAPKCVAPNDCQTASCSMGTCSFVNKMDGTVCMGSVANGTPVCAAGACAGVTCNVGFGNCNNNVADGCEVSLTSNVANCGGCGVACAAGANQTASCTNSVCGKSCSAGFADCNMNQADGCEINLKTNANNCGACGSVCNQPGALSCVNGACGLGLAGSYNVINGPAWGNNPPTYTCQEACALLFGGASGNYQCSTVNNTINRNANTSIWGIAGCQVVADTFKKAVNYNCAAANCSQSAYVQDNCNGTNYCFR